MAIVLALTSALIYGVADFCGGRAARAVNAVHVTFIGESASLVVIGAAVLAIGTPMPTGHVLAISAVGGMANAAGQTLLYWSLARGSMAVVAPVAAAVGAMVPVIVGLVSGERPALAGYAGIALGCVAVALVSRAITEHLGRPTPRRAIAAAALAGAGFGVMFAVLHETPESSGAWPLVAARLAAVPMLGVVIAAGRLRGGAPLPPRAARRNYSLAGAAGQLDMTGTLLYTVAVRGGMMSTIAVIASLYPVGTVTLALTIDRERLCRVQQIGIGLAGAALVLVTVGHR